MLKEEFMELPCRYCKEKKLLALGSREYSNGLFVVNAICDDCGRTQKHSNKLRTPKVQER